MGKDIFIASPLFNPPQIEVIRGIEELCEKNSLSYYSARHDSEPHVPRGEAKKNPDAWDAVFQNNEEGLQECKIMIAVLSYHLPEGQKMGIGTGIVPPFEHHVKMADFRPLELPDSGTVWEMGYFRALEKIVVGFHPDKRGDHLNLMLTHGCDALISGWPMLQQWFGGGDLVSNVSSVQRIAERVNSYTLNKDSYLLASRFDWSSSGTWGAQVGDTAL